MRRTSFLAMADDSGAPDGRDQQQLAADGPSDLVGRRVVICEDEGINQMQLRRCLTRAGLDVVGMAGNGRDGVAVTLAEHPDIVLMDIRMPVMDGLEAGRQIAERLDVCIVMLTAFADSEYQEEARSFGASGYVLKPVTGDALLPLLEQAWRDHTARRNASRPE